MSHTRVAAVCLLFGAFAVPLTAGPTQVMFEFTNTLVATDRQLILDGSITINASNTGWYDSTGFHAASNSNYVVGLCGTGCGSDLEIHDFFVFSIPVGVAPFTSATLRLMNPPNGANAQNGYFSTNPSELLTLYDVSTGIGTLTASQTNATAIYNDLGSGVTYASRVVSATDNGTFVTINLNAAALAAINAASGGQFAIGGSLNIAAVPEPATTGLIGLALLSGFALRRRRR